MARFVASASVGEFLGSIRYNNTTLKCLMFLLYRMSYDEKKERVRRSLIEFVKEQISSRYNYNNEFHMWSYSEIKAAYVSKFKEEFSEYINEIIEIKLWFAGQNIGFGVQAFIDTNPNYTLRSLVEYVETFLIIQLDNFENWCDEIMLAMPAEDNPENDRDDNPT